jgi:hypothetical protein
MSQNTRFIVAVVVVVFIVGAVLGIDALRRRSSGTPISQGQESLAPGSIPITVNGELVGGFTPDDLDELEQVSFTDAEEGKTQEGWRLRDVLLQHIAPGQLGPETRITVSSSSRGKEAQLTWAEVEDPANWVMFDLSGRGTLKLVSVLGRLDVRDEWVQDVDKITVETEG